MNARTSVLSTLSLLCIVASACSDVPTSPSSDLQSGARMSSAKGAAGGTGCDLTPVLPQVAPAPDVLLRESFGPGPNLVRPNGGKGCNVYVGLHQDIAGYWVEYPGTRNTAWIAPAEVPQTWRLCGSSNNPYEMDSPLQVQYGGCLASDWFDPVATRPTALMPFVPPTGAYEIHLDMWPGLGDPTYYLGFGITSSGVLDRNLESAGDLWFEFTNADIPVNMVTYNVRLNGRTGPVLATGRTVWAPWMPVDLRYDAATQTVSAAMNQVELGSWQVPALKATKYIAIEGVGLVDNLVVRRK